MTVTDNNIPESLLIGKGECPVFEVPNKTEYDKIVRDFSGAVFHKVKDGRYFIKVLPNYVRYFVVENKS